MKNHENKNTRFDNHDNYSEDVCKELSALGFTFQIATSIGGVNIDIVVSKNGKSFGIDLIGYPGEFVEHYSLEHHRMFRRADFTIIPLPYLNWIEEKEQCLSFINSFVDVVYK